MNVLNLSEEIDFKKCMDRLYDFFGKDREITERIGGVDNSSVWRLRKRNTDRVTFKMGLGVIKLYMQTFPADPIPTTSKIEEDFPW